MRKTILYLFVILSAFSLNNTYAQVAKKPKIMVVPSDALMNQMGLLNTDEDLGETVWVQNYRKAFLNIELKAIISKFGEMMKERGFETVLLESELKRVQGKGQVVPFDIRVDLTYKITRQGPRKILYAEFTGVDEYSGKQIAAASGESAPAIAATAESLLQEAVLDKIDQFNNQLMATFEEMAVKGRESRLEIISEELSLDDEFNGKSLTDIVEDWLNTNCIESSFTTDDQTESNMRVSQAMMPLFDANGKALDARNFYKGLEKTLNAVLSSQGYKAKFTKRKLAEVEITIESNS